MEQIDVSHLESGGGTTDADVRSLTEALGTTDFAINHFHLEPGESFVGGLHTHLDQEEVFYVLEGTATFETPDGQFELESDQAVRFAPGEYHEGHNESDGDLSVLAMGAPKDSTEVRVPQPCTECGEADSLAVEADEDEELYLECPECGATMDAPV